MSIDAYLPASAEQPDSQFLPGTNIQFAWDSVSLTAVLACPRRYRYSIIDGYVPKARGYAIALIFGILFHKGMEHYAQAKAQGATHDEAVHFTVAAVAAHPSTVTLPTDEDVQEIADTSGDDDDGIHLRNSKVRTRYYLFRAIIWYLEHYRDDPAETIILPSGKAAVEVSFRLPIELPALDYPLVLCGHMDRGVRFNDRLYVMDHKTTKSLTRQFFDSFQLSHQLTGYAIAGSAIFDQPVSGTLVDGIALQVGQVKLGRAPITKTQGSVREYFDTLGFAAQQAKLFYERDFYPMNTSACYFCDFKEVCSQPPEYRDRYLNMLFERKRGWNPLENR